MAVNFIGLEILNPETNIPPGSTYPFLPIGSAPTDFEFYPDGFMFQRVLVVEGSVDTDPTEAENFDNLMVEVQNRMSAFATAMLDNANNWDVYFTVQEIVEKWETYKTGKTKFDYEVRGHFNFVTTSGFTP